MHKYLSGYSQRLQQLVDRTVDFEDMKSGRWVLLNLLDKHRNCGCSYVQARGGLGRICGADPKYLEKLAWHKNPRGKRVIVIDSEFSTRIVEIYNAMFSSSDYVVEGRKYAVSLIPPKRISGEKWVAYTALIDRTKMTEYRLIEIWEGLYKREKDFVVANTAFVAWPSKRKLYYTPALAEKIKKIWKDNFTKRPITIGQVTRGEAESDRISENLAKLKYVMSPLAQQRWDRVYKRMYRELMAMGVDEPTPLPREMCAPRSDRLY